MENTLEKFSKAIAQIDTKSDDENKLTFLAHQEKQLYKILVHLDAAYLNVNTYKETDNEELYDYIVRRKRYWFKRGYYRAAITKFVRGDLVIMLEKVLKFINEIEDRKNIITKMGSEMEKDYEKLYNQLVEHNFDQNILRGQIEKLSETEEENYLKFCVRKFRHRTVEEWMQFYDRQDKSEQMKRLKEARLDPELEYINTLRITDAKFSESVLGQYTKKNLELFKEKYADNKTILKGSTGNKTKDVKLLEEILELREKIEDYRSKVNRINREIKILHKEKTELEKSYDKDVTDFPVDLRTKIKKNKERIIQAEKERVKCKLALWGTFDTEGMVRRHDRLYDEYKRLVLDDDELNDELKNKSIDRYTEKLKHKIKAALMKINIEVDDDELLDLTLNVLSEVIENEDGWYEDEGGTEGTKYDEVIDIVLKRNYKEYIKEPEYQTFNFDFDKIKEFANKLDDEAKYKYYIRLQVDNKRILNSFSATEFRNFDGNKYQGLKEFKDSCNYILEKEKCPELNKIILNVIGNLKEESGEKEFNMTLTYIDIALFKEEGRLKKVNELVGYEVEYLERILHITNSKKQIDKKQELELSSEQIVEEVVKENGIEERRQIIIDQDSLIEKFKNECEKRKLQKGKTIPPEILYEIAMAIGFKVPKIEEFKAGEKFYQESREYASRLGYKKRRRMEE